MFNFFRKKKLIVIHYVNVMGLTKTQIKSKLEGYEENYFHFKDDKSVEEMCIPTNGDAKVEIIKR